MINYAKYLLRKNMLQGPQYMNLILGNIACAQATLLLAGIMIRDLPEKTYWALAGVGNAQLAMNSVAIAIGGGIRIGIEDNYWYDTRRTRLATNAELLKRAHVIAEANERRVMSSTAFRRLLGLRTDGEYGVQPHPPEKTADAQDRT
jgi:uncharacterized protein (DUF849 family)